MRLASQPARRFHSPGLLWRLYLAVRGSAQIMVRPAPELPLVLIAFLKHERAPAAELRGALEETWLTIPAGLRDLYKPVLRNVPPLVVVILRRKNMCSCLGHHHPSGAETHLARRLRKLSGVRVAELDLAYQAIREWQPLPLADLAAEDAIPEADRTEVEIFRFRLGLLDVFLHELHHYAAPGDPEREVRGLSQRFYAEVLDAFMQARFGVRYGLRQ